MLRTNTRHESLPRVDFCDECSRVSTPAERQDRHLEETRNKALFGLGLVRP
ncbi:MAG: hypothetical protein OEW30_17520 [Acidimicrobiia bacterium]|nr:hypothetical protein [Acidimicrobiia bacterium]